MLELSTKIYAVLWLFYGLSKDFQSTGNSWEDGL